MSWKGIVKIIHIYKTLMAFLSKLKVLKSYVAQCYFKCTVA